MHIWLYFIRIHRKAQVARCRLQTWWMHYLHRLIKSSRALSRPHLLFHFIISWTIMSLKSKESSVFAVSGQSIRSPRWLLIGSRPIDTQLLAAHIKGLRGWRKKSQIFRQWLSSNCRKCGQTDGQWSTVQQSQRAPFTHGTLSHCITHMQTTHARIPKDLITVIGFGTFCWSGHSFMLHLHLKYIKCLKCMCVQCVCVGVREWFC